MTVVKLIRGPSRSSHLLIAWRHVHLFAWTPRMNNGYGPGPSFGFTIRARRNDVWRHARVVLMQRNRQGQRLGSIRDGRWLMRPTLTLFEASSWLTAPDTSTRIDVKSYVRFKASAGGRMVA